MLVMFVVGLIATHCMDLLVKAKRYIPAVLFECSQQFNFPPVSAIT